MKVRVKLHGILRRHLPAGAEDNTAVLDLASGATVADVLAHLGIPEKHTAMFVSADQHLEPTTPLVEGRVLEVFPPLAGGV